MIQRLLLSYAKKNPETLESALQACETACWQQILSIAPFLSPQLLLLVAGDGFRIPVDSSGSPKRSAKNTVVDSLLRKLSREPNGRLNSMCYPPEVSRYRCQTGREAEHMLTRAHEQLQSLNSMLPSRRSGAPSQKSTCFTRNDKNRGQCTPCKGTSKGASIGDEDSGCQTTGMGRI